MCTLIENMLEEIQKSSSEVWVTDICVSIRSSFAVCLGLIDSIRLSVCKALSGA